MPTRTRVAADTRVNLRRMYADCRYGQLHVRSAFPSSGGFDEKTTLLCFHQSPMSSHVFRPLLPLLGLERSVYAPDTPGYGESDAPTAPPDIADYAAAFGDFLDHMRLKQVDLLGYHTGALIAAELAIARPKQVRRVIMVAAPVFNAEETAAFNRRPWPVPIREDGSHLAEEWQRTIQWRGPGVTLDQLAAGFAVKIGNGPNAFWGARAALNYPAMARLPLVTQPVLVLRPRDDLWDITPRADSLLRDGRRIDLPEYGFGLLEVAAEVVSRHARDFLDR